MWANSNVFIIISIYSQWFQRNRTKEVILYYILHYILIKHDCIEWNKPCHSLDHWNQSESTDSNHQREAQLIGRNHIIGKLRVKGINEAIGYFWKQIGNNGQNAYEDRSRRSSLRIENQFRWRWRFPDIFGQIDQPFHLFGQPKHRLE